MSIETALTADKPFEPVDEMMFLPPVHALYCRALDKRQGSRIKQTSASA